MITNNHDDDDPPSRRWMYVLLIVLACASGYVWWPRFKVYPEVTSRESLQLMKLLYAACNTRDPVRLEKVEKQLKNLIHQGKMSDKEQQSFQKIVALVHAGEWKQAESESFRFAQDQVR